ncbi:MAG: PCRF domain-containing protein [Candidatus Shikimatogenerans bostrichidophilus]|nr:MAG: PCRF domain-containing protein [Candidatus Shikimatogenerans bostrichidophilus]
MIINNNINITINNLKKIINIKNIIIKINNLNKKINKEKNIEYIKKIKKSKKIYKKIINIYNFIILIYKDIKILNLILNNNIKNNYEIILYKNKINKLINKLITIIFKKKYIYNALIYIYSGSGGKDSNDWVKILNRMYIMWSIKNNFKYKDINNNNILNKKKTSIIKIYGKYVFGFLYGENGIHKLIRNSPFNKKKKRQTSLAYVIVYPIKKKKKIKINKKDLILNTFRSSGSGGQNVNKVETGVRIKHIPTKITVEYTKTRSQILNKKKAINILKYKLLNFFFKKKKKKKNLYYIRNYIMHPYKLIKDFKTGYKTNNFNKIINGNINDLIFEYIKKKKIKI